MAKEKRPAMPLYVRDILADQHFIVMSLAERGAYMTLLMHCWMDRYIPDDPAQCSRLVGCSEEEMRTAWPAIRRRFKRAKKAGLLIHGRVEEERSACQIRHLRRVQSAKIGASKRWSINDIHANGIGPAMPKTCLSVSSSVSSSVSKEKEKSDYDPVPGWDKFMEEYPGELIPDRDCPVWMSVMNSPEDEATLWRNLPAWLSSRKFQEGFAPAAKNFLFDGHWKVPPREPVLRKSKLDEIMEDI